MWPYWVMFLLPAAAALLTADRVQRSTASGRAAASAGPVGSWVIAAIALILMIGFRHEVGGDWQNYFEYIYGIQGASIQEVLKLSDPGYQLLNWVSVEMGWGIYGVNAIGAVAFTIGLSVFCRSLARPWLAFTVSVPYLIIVVAMGYSRQGIALGFTLLAFVALQRRRVVWFAGWILIGATFHKTAVLIIPIAALAGSRQRILSAVWAGVISIVAYQLFLEESIEALYANYVEAEYRSEGALVRLLMNALPAGLLLWYNQRFVFTEGELRLWVWMSIISLALLALLAISPSSTAVDRIALYMLPLQLVVFSKLPTVLGKSRAGNVRWTAIVIAYYFIVQAVWLNFAANAGYWVPYRSYLLESLY